MMKIANISFRIILLIVLAVCSSALRGGSSGKAIKKLEVVHTNNSHRHLLPSDSDLECVLFMRDIEFEDKISQEDWCCEFHSEQKQMIGGRQDMFCIEGISNESLEGKGAKSGETILKIRNAFIEEFFDETKETKLVIAEDDAEVEALSETDRRHARQRRRNLASSQPGTTLRTLVVRVIDAAGAQIDADVAQLQDDVFEDAVSLRTQYAACSHDQLKIEPASNFGGGTGIVNVNVDVTASFDSATNAGNRNALEEAAISKTMELYGTGNNADGYNGLTDNFDLILVCQPPGSGSWVAYAYVNNFLSFYNHHWCQRVSAQMHEVGHNLNLAHSGAPGSNPASDQYEDNQGMMGFSFSGDDGPQMCFNPAKNVQLGWFDDQSESINPLNMVGGSSQTFTLNGIVDYDFGNNDALVTLRLDNQGGEDYYIGFNKASGFNGGTTEAINSVTILTKNGGPKENGASTRMAILSENGDSYQISGWAGSILDVFITLDDIANDGKDAIITIKISEPYPTEAPTSNCASTDGQFKLDLTTDKYGVESTWSITKDSTGDIVYEDNDGYSANTNYILPDKFSSYCLEAGECYTFTMMDGYGDGMCCQFGDGGYNGYLNDELKFTGSGEFGAEQKHSFCVPASEEFEDVSTEAPSLSPTTQPTLPKCIDTTEKIKFKQNGKTKNWNCQKIKKKKKCTKTEKDTDIPLWNLCPVKCQKFIPSNELQNLSCAF